MRIIEGKLRYSASDLMRFKGYLGVADPGVSIEAIIEQVERETGRKGWIAVTSVDEAIRRHGDWIAGQARSQRIATRKAVNEVGWCPERHFLLSERG